ncbi:MAG: hypothetical protein JKY20_12535 [Alphaproteobacteria bacterium]|nr:hypothetical protein [Alphaproteobacteria bacterium]
MKNCIKNCIIGALGVLAIGLTIGTPAQAAPDKSCLVYVSMISKQLKTRFRLSRPKREQIKILRQQGGENINDGKLCRPPLVQALRLLGVRAPVIETKRAQPQRRRTHRLGSN